MERIKQYLSKQNKGYKTVQFVAYKICTAHFTAMTDTEEDIKARIELVKEALQTAYNSLNESKDTLKIFMIPEFFFRGKRGAYEIKYTKQIITKLREIVADQKWEDWLCVFGTILVYSSPPPEKIAEEQKKVVYNFALVQKGGWNGTKSLEDTMKYKMEEVKTDRINSKKGFKLHPTIEQELWLHKLEKLGKNMPTAFIILKQELSDRDFNIKPKNNSVNALDEQLFYEDVEYGKKIPNEIIPSGTSCADESTFSYDTITFLENKMPIVFGLEVCLDHHGKRLKKTPGNSLYASIDIQLITSCGLQKGIFPDAIAAKQNGYVFLCDGSHSYGEYGLVQLIKRKSHYGYNNQKIDNIDKEDIILATSPAHIEMKDLNDITSIKPVNLIEKSISIKEQNNIKNKIFVHGLGSVLICPPQPLTSPQQVGQLGIAQSLFPQNTSSLTLTMSDEPILLNGMKVLFDNPVPTTPVTLQPKQRGTNNGR